jgi:hypothetical protein
VRRRSVSPLSLSQSNSGTSTNNLGGAPKLLHPREFIGAGGAPLTSEVLATADRDHPERPQNERSGEAGAAWVQRTRVAGGTSPLTTKNKKPAARAVR